MFGYDIVQVKIKYSHELCLKTIDGKKIPKDIDNSSKIAMNYQIYSHSSKHTVHTMYQHKNSFYSSGT